MFFLVPSARQTRRTIWSGVSLNRSRSPSGPARTFFVSDAASKRVAPDEAVEVGDLDLRGLQRLELVRREEVALLVVVAGEVRPQDLEAVADGDARRDDEEGVGEPLVLGVGELVERLPGDEHGHDDGLAGAGRHLERDAVEPGVARLAVLAELVLDPGLAVAGDLGQEDRGLEGLDLAEEERLLPVGRRPVGEELAGDRGDAGVAGCPPGVDVLADPVDEVVVGHPLADPVAGQAELGAALRLGLGDRDEVRAPPAALGDLVRDPVVVEVEMPRRLANGEFRIGFSIETGGKGPLGLGRSVAVIRIPGERARLTGTRRRQQCP